MIREFQYQLNAERPESRFAETAFYVAAPSLIESQVICVPPVFCHDVFFTLKCQLEESGKFLLKQISGFAVTVSGMIRSAAGKVRSFITSGIIATRPAMIAVKRFLSLCVFRR